MTQNTTANTNTSLPDDMIDMYPYSLPDGFRPGTTFAGNYLTAFIANADNLKRPTGDPKREEKPKYAFSCAIPYENRKTHCRELQSLKFSCTEEDYLYLKACHDSLKFQSVYFVCAPDAWANSGSNYGIYYKYEPNTIRRFDGKPITDKKVA